MEAARQPMKGVFAMMEIINGKMYRLVCHTKTYLGMSYYIEILQKSKDHGGWVLEDSKWVDTWDEGQKYLDSIKAQTE